MGVFVTDAQHGAAFRCAVIAPLRGATIDRHHAGRLVHHVDQERGELRSVRIEDENIGGTVAAAHQQDHVAVLDNSISDGRVTDSDEACCTLDAQHLRLIDPHRVVAGMDLVHAAGFRHVGRCGQTDRRTRGKGAKHGEGKRAGGAFLGRHHAVLSAPEGPAGRPCEAVTHRPGLALSLA